ncbi:hypothetical protein GGR37_002588 [Novosphingobium taihuense]|uniref:Uncharacterized protein n=1 Tax=Novosphingobium taihuense TaxID=260085 RepID=A0A7W7ACA8_9SPHN|nr:hypothetical protein [Novosphingobium taihuense]
MHPSPTGQVKILKPAAREYPGIVDEDVAPTESAQNVIPQPADIFWAADIALKGNCVAAHGLDLVQRLAAGVEIDDSDRSTLARQSDRKGTTDPCSAACDDRDFA